MARHRAHFETLNETDNMIDANKEWDEIANFIDTIQDSTHEDDLFDVVKAWWRLYRDKLILKPANFTL